MFLMQVVLSATLLRLLRLWLGFEHFQCIGLKQSKETLLLKTATKL